MLTDDVLADIHSISNNRIVGGQNAREGEIPYQILVNFPNDKLCGGSLIKIKNKHYVLTAAHCVYGYSARQLSVVAGALRLSKKSANEQTRQVTGVTVHSKYEDGSELYQNDIALLGIQQNFQENSYVSPIGLPKRRQGTSGNSVVSGWGYEKENGRASDNLKWVRLPIIGNSECAKSYESGRVTSLNLCAGYKEGGKDSCQGDSGGPLLSQSGDYLAGVVSNGEVKPITI